jgi:hypothetical protein
MTKDEFGRFWERWYCLADDGKTPRKCESIDDVNKYHTQNRHIGDDTIDGVRVSTVFLGLDHGYGGSDPVLWETMVFGGRHDNWMDRYTSYESALAGHNRVVEAIKSGADLNAN